MCSKTINITFAALLSLLLMIGPAAAEESRLETIPLKHLFAPDVISTLAPLLSQDETVSAADDKLIIHATPARIEELKKVIREIDLPPKRLMITVKQLLEGEASRDDGSTKTYSTASRDNAIPIQRIQVIEGEPAMIETGEVIPVVTESGRDSTKIEYKKAATGFRAIAAVIGDQVVVDLMPYSITAGSGGIMRLQQGSTTLRGKLGEWLEVGGSATRMDETEGSRRYSTRSRSESARRIMLKITEQE